MQRESQFIVTQTIYGLFVLRHNILQAQGTECELLDQGYVYPALVDGNAVLALPVLARLFSPGP